MATDEAGTTPIEDADVILDAVAYVEEVHRELTSENTAPSVGALNQVVEVVLVDPELTAAARAWAQRNRVLEEASSPPGPPPADAAYRRVSELLRDAERNAGPGSDRLSGDRPNP